MTFEQAPPFKIESWSPQEYETLITKAKRNMKKTWSDAEHDVLVPMYPEFKVACKEQDPHFDNDNAEILKNWIIWRMRKLKEEHAAIFSDCTLAISSVENNAGRVRQAKSMVINNASEEELKAYDEKAAQHESDNHIVWPEALQILMDTWSQGPVGVAQMTLMLSYKEKGIVKQAIIDGSHSDNIPGFSVTLKKEEQAELLQRFSAYAKHVLPNDQAPIINDARLTFEDHGLESLKQHLVDLWKYTHHLSNESPIFFWEDMANNPDTYFDTKKTKAKKGSAAKPKAHSIDKAASAKAYGLLATRSAKHKIDPAEIKASDRPQKKIKLTNTSKNMKQMTVEKPKTALKPKKYQKTKPAKKAGHKGWVHVPESEVPVLLLDRLQPTHGENLPMHRWRHHWRLKVWRCVSGDSAGGAKLEIQNLQMHSWSDMTGETSLEIDGLERHILEM
ncbi:uncharacterized protein EV420DRAFT_1651412 [Desarmillaria tabescens]|uniref:Uncharacterized protein n=1 Tax=Armillaria tabescens TaxID=1929756 RepID=A0AA39J986_ARMTA|nr:uncharacterized protein EV420DRAFT_1651412 [Desarmillaria tabescens]KAK0438490.1 hypothetical protein EV420DRAFT_1651412 [Desarmillaria tabescens]